VLQLNWVHREGLATQQEIKEEENQGDFGLKQRSGV